MTKTKRLCVFQMHHTDVCEALAEHNAVVRLRDSGLFDQVVIAAANLPENRVLAEWAERWEVPIAFGHVRDLARRIRECCERFHCDTVARTMVWRFFVDPELIERQLCLLEEGAADHVQLPLDFDLRFGADVFTRGFLDRTLEAAEGRKQKEAYQFSPWGYAEVFPQEFELRSCEDVPTLGAKEHATLVSAMREFGAARWESSPSRTAVYEKAAQFVPMGGSVLDAGCGTGKGTHVLARYARALGVDVDGAALETAARTHREREGLSYAQQDLREGDLAGGEYDAVVCARVLEYLEDDAWMLSSLSRALRPGGTLIVEAPLRYERPFEGIDAPLAVERRREYRLQELLDRMPPELEVDEVFGVSRGYYVPAERARSAAMVVARRK